MFRVRIHGRGGQGVVTAAEVLSVAAFLEEKYAQAFPSFGSERMGAPVMAFCRIDDTDIHIREPVLEPDALIIQDPTLIHQVDLFTGLNPKGYVLINSSRTLSELGLEELSSRISLPQICTVPATEFAMKHLGKPFPNAALLGGFSAITGQVAMSSIARAIQQKFPGSVGDANAASAAAAHAFVCETIRENLKRGAHATAN